MMMSQTQNEGIHVNYSTPTNKVPPEGKTMATIAMMRGKPKDGYHCHRSNKHHKQKLVRVLLDSGSDRDLIFVANTAHTASLLKKAGSTVVEYLEWNLRDQAKARV
jgi:hypothetical protein